MARPGGAWAGLPTFTHLCTLMARLGEARLCIAWQVEAGHGRVPAPDSRGQAKQGAARFPRMISWRGIAWSGTARPGPARLGEAPLGEVRHGEVRTGKARHGEVRRGEVPANLHVLAGLGFAVRGLVWLGVARTGPARRGVAGHGWLGTAGFPDQPGAWQVKARLGLAVLVEPRHGVARRGLDWQCKVRLGEALQGEVPAPDLRGVAWRGLARQGRARRGKERHGVAWFQTLSRLGLACQGQAGRCEVGQGRVRQGAAWRGRVPAIFSTGQGMVRPGSAWRRTAP